MFVGKTTFFLLFYSADIISCYVASNNGIINTTKNFKGLGSCHSLSEVQNWHLAGWSKPNYARLKSG